jgi:Tfp pilus assembly protein PilO
MFRVVTPLILIGISVAVFLIFVNPMYKEVSSLRTEINSYNEALNNSNVLDNERDKLTKKYNAIDPADLDKLQKLLPDNVDNIRLILEIEKLASPYGMVLKDIRYNTQKKEEGTNTNTLQGGQSVSSVGGSDFGVWTLEFSTEGSYKNFLSFLKDLESNLRVVDIASIQFSSTNDITKGTSESYKYAFKINTYWMKN